MKWEKAKLGDLFQIKHGWAFKGEYFSNEGELIIVTPGNFFEKGGFRQLAGKEKFYLGEFPNEFLLKKNDVIIAMTEQGPGLLGSPAIVPSNEKYLHNQRIGLIHEIKADKIDPMYIYRLFFTSNVRNEIFSSATGTKVKHTAPKRIYDIDVNLPPLHTQRKIASILSAYDDLIENNLKRIKLLEEKALLRYKQIVREEKFLLKAFNEVADYINGYPFKPEDWKDEGLPIIKINELKAGVQDDTPRNDGENIPEKYFIENKDILFAWSASIGAYLWCLGKSILNQHIFNVKPFDKEFHNWLYFSLLEKIPDFMNLSNGATMQHIKKSALGMVYLPVPPKKVYEEFQKETDPILNLLINLNQQNTKLREARGILLPKLMNGQIEV